MDTRLKIKDLPKEIAYLAYRNIANQNLDADDNEILCRCFSWINTPEGAIFWSEIEKGNFDVYYKPTENKMFLDEFINHCENNKDLIFHDKCKIHEDTVVESIIDSFKKRSEAGIEKYGTTLDRNDLCLAEWLIHLQEELQDAILYSEKIKSEVGKKKFVFNFDNVLSVTLTDNDLIVETK